jgi:hypothetical protein
MANRKAGLPYEILILGAGGVGFHASFVIEELARVGFRDIAAPRSSEYGLSKPQGS